MDFVFEILFEVYLELMMLVVPEEKTTLKRYRYASIAVALLVIVGVLALFVWGCVLLFEENRKIGILPISLAILLSLAQMIAGILLYRRR